MFPLFLDLTDRLVLVVGGGPVGRRKATSLLEAGAIVRLVCLETQPADWQRPRLVWMAEPYTADHLAGASLAFACAAPEVNQLVAADARRRGIWVNRADDPAGGDIELPATLRRGAFVIAVGSGGSSPTLARQVRDQLEPQFDDAYGEWVALLKKLRVEVQSLLASEPARRELWRRWSDPRWLERLRREGSDAVAAALREELRAAARG